MFAKEGYTPLATLWGEFERAYLEWCNIQACAHFESYGFTIYNVFGSPRDLCENLFLRTMEKHELALLTSTGEIIRSPATLPDTNASMFTKATVFESMAIVNDPDEAGMENEWVLQMGSNAFDYWPHMEADYASWSDRYCASEATNGCADTQGRMPFHTLPYCFERATYIIPKKLPPWTIDMIDTSFARNLSGAVLGSSICLDDCVAGKWRRKLNEAYLLELFFRMMNGALEPDVAEAEPKSGRPNKVSKIAKAYVELGLIDSDLSWKAKHTKLMDHLGMEFSKTTLKSAAKLAAAEKRDRA